MKCTRLKRLILNHNKLSGILPPTLSNLTNLEVLYLNNCIHGVIPHDIGNLIILDILILHGNDIIGPTPISLQKLTKLRDFSCFSNMDSDAFKIPRVFNRRRFERIYVTGPHMKLDNVHWSNVTLYGDNPNPVIEKPVPIIARDRRSMSNFGLWKKNQMNQ